MDTESDEAIKAGHNPNEKSLQHVEEDICYFCGDHYCNSKPNEKWAKCSGQKRKACWQWAHVLCLDTSNEKSCKRRCYFCKF